MKIFFRNAYEIKTFLYERKLIELAASRTALSIKEVLQTPTHVIPDGNLKLSKEIVMEVIK